MTVYKLYLKIMKANVGTIVLYLAIFFGITMILQSVTKDTAAGSYSAQSLKVGIVDEDGGALAHSLTDYLGTCHEILMLEDDTKILQENLFYGNVDYIVRIPANFKKVCLEDGQKLSVTKIPGSYNGYYVDQQMNNFLNNAAAYDAAGYTDDELILALSQEATAAVSLISTDTNDGTQTAYNYYFQLLPYLFLSVLCYVFGYILIAIHKGQLPKRMAASAVSARRQSLEGLLAAATLGMGLWLFCIVMAVILYQKPLLGDSGFVYYLANSFALMLVTLAIAYFISTLVNNRDALTGITNILSLGMSFLCGVFVPLNIMSKGVRNAAQLLPVYWFENANKLLYEYGSITGSVRTSVLSSIGIQLVFAAAFVGIALAVTKYKRQTNA